MQIYKAPQNKKIKKMMGIIFYSMIFLGMVKVSVSKIVINLPRTYEKLQCKGEPYRSISLEDPSVHTKRQSQRHHVLFII